MVMLYIKGLIWLVNDLSKNMSYGISNFEIEGVFKEINNPDINKNFLVFPSDKISS